MLSVQPLNRNNTSLQGGSGGASILQGNHPSLQASSGSGIQLQPASIHSAAILHPTVNPQSGIPLHVGGGSSAPNVHAASNVGGGAAPQPSTGSGSSYGRGYSYQTNQFNAAQAQHIADLENAAYNQKIASLQQLMQGLGPRQAGLNQEIGRQYDSENQTLNAGHQQALRDIALGLQQLGTNHDLSLRNVKQTGQDTTNSLNYKVGTMTPYDTSATPLIALALAKQMEMQRGDLGQQYGYQQTGFNNKQADANQNFGNSANSLNVWKTNNLQDIARNVQDYQNQLQSQIQDTDTSRQLALANLANYNGGAILGNLSQLQSQFNPNNIGYNPVDHQGVQTAVQNMTSNIPQVQQFNIPSLGAIQ